MKALFTTVAVVAAVVPNPVYGNDKQLECLAQNIYHEARGESLVGQIGVALVTINRMYDRRFPNTICKVVKQGIFRSPKLPNIVKRNRCQFSWYCDGKSDKIRNKKAYNKAYTVAYMVYNEMIADVTNGATHYHATYVRPYWARKLNKTVKLDKHIFYKWK